MNSMGLIVHDDQTFFAKVVDLGVEKGTLTRDRADEVVRISVAMANKYVIQKEIDFRSVEELEKVQETILKLVGIGMEIKSGGNVESGLQLLMEASPVELFRIAYTRIEKLRHAWQLLLHDHRIQIFVTQNEFDCLTDLTCRRLGQMSIFSDVELHTISSLKLGDDLFSNLGILEYYEGELEKYSFILKLRSILPFNLLNKSSLVRAENLSEVDVLREAFINTLLITGYVESEFPAAVSMLDVRLFLKAVEDSRYTGFFPEDVENVLIDLIQELAQGLEEHDAAMLTKEIVRISQKLLESIITEWDTAASESASIFFKKWARMAILSDMPDPMERILSSSELIDEFDFEIMINHLSGCSEEEALTYVGKLPWDRMTPDQIIRMFQQLESLQEKLAEHLSIEKFNAAEVIDLIEGISQPALKQLMPEFSRVFPKLDFSLEDLELIGGLPQADAIKLLHMTGCPADCDTRHAISEFRSGTEKIKQVIFHSCLNSDLISDLFHEAWAMNPSFVKREIKHLSASEIGPLLLRIQGARPKMIHNEGEKIAEPEFASGEANSLYKSLPAFKKKAVIKFLSDKGKNPASD